MANAGSINITTKLSGDAITWAKNVTGRTKEFFYKGMVDAMLAAESYAKKNFGGANQPKVVTGRLKSSITGRASKYSSIGGAAGEVKGSLSTPVIYGGVQEGGATIKPKTKTWLYWERGGALYRAKQVVIPARPYMYPAVEKNIDKIVDIITNKIMEGISK